jgi:hypothetical protein
MFLPSCPLLSKTPLMANAARSSARTPDKEPLNEPIGDLQPSKINASLIDISIFTFQKYVLK